MPHSGAQSHQSRIPPNLTLREKLAVFWAFLRYELNRIARIVSSCNLLRLMIKHAPTHQGDGQWQRSQPILPAKRSG